jgi:CRP/FNR family cyclic AMP-dependent transcriptional regulator
MTDLAKGLRQVPFFQSLEDFQLQHLIKRGKHLSLESDTVVFRKADAGNCMYVILSGQIQIYLEAADGRVAPLRVLDAGDFFGEMALLDGKARSANVRSLTACELFTLERAAFLDLMTTLPELLSKVFSGLSERLRATDERFLQIENQLRQLNSQSA